MSVYMMTIEDGAKGKMFAERLYERANIQRDEDIYHWKRLLRLEKACPKTQLKYLIAYPPPDQQLPTKDLKTHIFNPETQRHFYRGDNGAFVDETDSLTDDQKLTIQLNRSNAIVIVSDTPCRYPKATSQETFDPPFTLVDDHAEILFMLELRSLDAKNVLEQITKDFTSEGKYIVAELPKYWAPYFQQLNYTPLLLNRTEALKPENTGLVIYGIGSGGTTGTIKAPITNGKIQYPKDDDAKLDTVKPAAPVEPFSSVYWADSTVAKSQFDSDVETIHEIAQVLLQKPDNNLSETATKTLLQMYAQMDYFVKQNPTPTNWQLLVKSLAHLIRMRVVPENNVLDDFRKTSNSILKQTDPVELQLHIAKLADMRTIVEGLLESPDIESDVNLQIQVEKKLRKLFKDATQKQASVDFVVANASVWSDIAEFAPDEVISVQADLIHRNLEMRLRPRRLQLLQKLQLDSGNLLSQINNSEGNNDDSVKMQLTKDLQELLARKSQVAKDASDFERGFQELLWRLTNTNVRASNTERFRQWISESEAIQQQFGYFPSAPVATQNNSLQMMMMNGSSTASTLLTTLPKTVDPPISDFDVQLAMTEFNKQLERFHKEDDEKKKKINDEIEKEYTAVHLKYQRIKEIVASMKEIGFLQSVSNLHQEASECYQRAVLTMATVRNDKNPISLSNLRESAELMKKSNECVDAYLQTFLEKQKQADDSLKTAEQHNIDTKIFGMRDMLLQANEAVRDAKTYVNRDTTFKKDMFQSTILQLETLRGAMEAILQQVSNPIATDMAFVTTAEKTMERTRNDVLKIALALTGSNQDSVENILLLQQLRGSEANLAADRERAERSARIAQEHRMRAEQTLKAQGAVLQHAQFILNPLRSVSVSRSSLQAREEQMHESQRLELKAMIEDLRRSIDQSNSRNDIDGIIAKMDRFVEQYNEQQHLRELFEEVQDVKQEAYALIQSASTQRRDAYQPNAQRMQYNDTNNNNNNNNRSTTNSANVYYNNFESDDDDDDNSEEYQQEPSNEEENIIAALAALREGVETRDIEGLPDLLADLEFAMAQAVPEIVKAHSARARIVTQKAHALLATMKSTKPENLDVFVKKARTEKKIKHNTIAQILKNKTTKKKTTRETKEVNDNLTMQNNEENAANFQQQQQHANVVLDAKQLVAIEHDPYNEATRLQKIDQRHRSIIGTAKRMAMKRVDEDMDERGQSIVPDQHGNFYVRVSKKTKHAASTNFLEDVYNAFQSNHVRRKVEAGEAKAFVQYLEECREKNGKETTKVVCSNKRPQAAFFP